MGTYVFTWSQPASEVYVTGTFDDWKKTAKLDKENGVFTRQVDLPSADKPILYKFVVDGTWTVDNSQPLESDASGNVNNLLKPEDISKIPVGGRSSHGAHPAPTTAATAAAAGILPGATTLGMAAEVPKEKTGDDAMPGAASGEQTFSVNPIPATAGAGNPVSLKPGEPVPAVTSESVDHAAKTDKAAYEKSDAYPGGTESASTGASPFISSTGPGSTTAALAAQVPMEPRAQQAVAESTGDSADEKAKTAAVATGGAVAGVAGGLAAGAAAVAAGVPASITNALSSLTGVGSGSAAEPKEPAAAVPEPVKEAQAEAHASPEASGNPEAVAEKSAVEKELLSKVPVTNEAADPGPSATTAATSATAPGGAFATDPVIADSSTAPAIAAMSTGAVAPVIAGPAPTSTTSAAAASGTPAAFKDDPVAAPGAAGTTAAPVAAAPVAAFKDDPVSAGSLNAAGSTPAKSAATQAAATATTTTPSSAAAKADSRDVSPHTKPQVTSGIESTAAGSQQTASASAGGASSSATSTPTKDGAADKKNKRRSFFGKIKDKLKS